MTELDQIIRMHTHILCMCAKHVNQQCAKERKGPSQNPRFVLLCRMHPADFAQIVRSRLEETKQSPYSAAVSHRLPRDAIRYVLSGRMPRLDRVVQICEALGLELHVGPPRTVLPDGSLPDGAAPVSALVHPTHELVRLVCDAGEDPIPDDLWPVLLERRHNRKRK